MDSIYFFKCYTKNHFFLIFAASVKSHPINMVLRICTTVNICILWLSTACSCCLSRQVEAALRAACDAKRYAEQERAVLADERDVVSTERCRLETLERDLTRKARDLDNMTQLAVDTREDGLRGSSHFTG